MSRISVFTGHFGSGKTEISVNYAKKLARQGKKVAIVDIDIVNPYFCSRNLKKEFDELGIKVIASDPNLMNAELMVVPSEVMAVFNDKSYEVVMDIGGDDQGATVLGQYNRYFREEDYDMYFVINNNRPLTSTTEDTIEYIKSIEHASRLKVNYLISNSNLSYDTTVDHILNGDKLVKELSEKINVPYKYVVCDKKFVNDIQGKVHAEILPVDIYMKPPWR
ncbi:ATP-binding protein [Clostridium niameyense]|uniref:ATP-binding protein n=1 Tax=Clostridium niameyense TaxID=1622073 RepID=A0A6M0R8U9_9CLOT|nr:ATP-binding protein [Clostridium niameyense]NEZ46672.1 ATP-binding protein [Clostridium niameyense]